MGTRLRIEGGNKLRGTIKIGAAKNALLPVLAACVLVPGRVVLREVPDLLDIQNMLHILAGLGVSVRWVRNDNQDKGSLVEPHHTARGVDLVVDSSNMSGTDACAVEAKAIRGSIFLLGGILGRFKCARIAYPGGCEIGNRPIDLHIQGLRDIGVSVREHNGFCICNSRRARGGVVHLDFPSVGATENLILASVTGRNTVRIINAAKEPEIVDLANFLNACGGRVQGAGTSTIVIEGVSRLSGCTYKCIPDRIITGSYLIAVAAVGGEVTLTNTHAAHNESLITKLTKTGCRITCFDDNIHIVRDVAVRLPSLVSIQTSPYPGFPTDLQSQIAVLQARSRGVSAITENLFESRFRYVPELLKMGAKITVRDRVAIITGTTRLNSAKVTATDLRGGVALVIAALAADGATEISNAEYIYRGHESIEQDLAGVGANIIRIDD